ncbi:hypothetical protein [Streptomyces sp. NPDC001978]|uniref:hypothetical protein n=1 Tax=Streptomyces sp. NPDC001978 TaxID=3364627 RepID=UPI00367B9DF6
MGIFKSRRDRTAALEADALERRVLRARPPAHAGRLAEVEAELRECLDEAESRFGDGHAVTQLALCELSIGLLKAHRTVEAETGFRRLRILTELFSAEHACVRDARELLERAESAAAS